MTARPEAEMVRVRNALYSQLAAEYEKYWEEHKHDVYLGREIWIVEKLAAAQADVAALREALDKLTGQILGAEAVAPYEPYRAYVAVLENAKAARAEAERLEREKADLVTAMEGLRTGLTFFQPEHGREKMRADKATAEAERAWGALADAIDFIEAYGKAHATVAEGSNALNLVRHLRARAAVPEAKAPPETADA